MCCQNCQLFWREVISVLLILVISAVIKSPPISVYCNRYVVYRCVWMGFDWFLVVLLAHFLHHGQWNISLPLSPWVTGRLGGRYSPLASYWYKWCFALGQLEQDWLFHSCSMTVWAACWHEMTSGLLINEGTSLRPTNALDIIFDSIGINLMCWGWVNSVWFVCFIVAKIDCIWIKIKHNFLLWAGAAKPRVSSDPGPLSLAPHWCKMCC